MKVNIDKIFTIIFGLFALNHLWEQEIELFITNLLISVLYFRCYLYDKSND